MAIESQGGYPERHRRCGALMRKIRYLASSIAMAALSASANPQTIRCDFDAGGAPRFENALVMATGLAVNPDGAAASYTPGNHGYTYINNGVNMIVNGAKLPCAPAGNNKRCATAWAAAEAGDFKAGTPEFCAFAIAVVAVEGGPAPRNCENDRSRYVIGNGKGRPASGRVIRNVEGQPVTTYLSTTSLMHTRDGAAAYVDSSTLPGLVVPRARRELVGAVAWVRHGAHSTFAIVNDTGPAFGEGTVALHRTLRGNADAAEQPIGPIPVALRCTAVENLVPPFESRPDGGSGDKCRSGYRPTTASDIRAYIGIARDVETVILTRVKPPMRGHRAEIELTPAALKSLAATAGYDEARLATMADCLRAPRP